MPNTAQLRVGQTCPQCYSSGLHPRATKCKHCGSSLEKPPSFKWRVAIFGLCMIGALLSIGLIVLYGHVMEHHILCNASQAASKAC